MSPLKAEVIDGTGKRTKIDFSGRNVMEPVILSSYIPAECATPGTLYLCSDPHESDDVGTIEGFLGRPYFGEPSFVPFDRHQVKVGDSLTLAGIPELTSPNCDFGNAPFTLKIKGVAPKKQKGRR